MHRLKRLPFSCLTTVLCHFVAIHALVYSEHNAQHIDCTNYTPKPTSAQQISAGHFELLLKRRDGYQHCSIHELSNLYIIVASENMNESAIKEMFASPKQTKEILLIPVKEIKEDSNNNLRVGFVIENNQINHKLKYRFGIANYVSNYRRLYGFEMLGKQTFTIQSSPGNATSGLEVVLIIILAILLVITFVLLGVLIYINYSGDNKWHNLFIFWSKGERRNLIRRDQRNGLDQSNRCSTLSLGSFHEGNFEIKSNPLKISELSDTIPLMIENGTLKQEFSSISRGQLRLWDYAKQAQHKSKNRYGNLLPYDHSRVILETSDENSSDYINANYVDGYKCGNRYIATQGPVMETINDLWRMIWQFNCHQIVMLTSIDEGGKNKCDKYWPDQSQQYANIEVSLKKTENFADYIIRTFLAEKDGMKREIVQYHFISWPDHTVPMYSCSLLTFMGRIRGSAHYIPSQPIVVHCSAGVGRTGTFILLDAMLEMSKHEPQIDILQHLCVIRLQRINLVEKLAQYVFVHQALLEALSHEPTSIDCNNFHNYYAKLAGNDNKSMPLINQFQILNKLSPQVLNKELCKSAEQHPNMNRNPDLLPPDYARVIIPGNDDYINAVYVNGYKRRDAYIVTQLPLENTRFQFWQMVTSTSSKTIVLLQDITSDENIFWPTMHNKQVVYSEGTVVHVIRLISEEHHNNLTTRTLHLQNNDTTVKMFHVRGWSSQSNTPSSPETIVELIEKMETWHLTTNANNILVQCFDGNNACGVFCATAFIFDRIKEEQQVDVFLAVQTIRTTRPQFITDVAQYKLLHQIAICYLQHFDIYANFK